MYDSATKIFDRVSGLHDNGSTPSQGQEDDQPADTNLPENVIDDDVIDIKTIYPLWSMDTNDMSDFTDKTRQDK